MKTVNIFGGGTFSHIRSHLALAVGHFGETARKLATLCDKKGTSFDVRLHLTRMAGGASMVTNEDVKNRIQELLEDHNTKMIFMNASLVDFDGHVEGGVSGKYGDRLSSHNGEKYSIELTPAAKVIGEIRKTRKDIFLVGFKTTTGASIDEQYIAGLNLLKSSSCNLVLANDTGTRMNMVITPEEAKYHVTTNRDEALAGLVDMAYLRSNATFTRSTVVPEELVSWDSPLVPETLRVVVDHCIKCGAYKPFRASTVGHFACKIGHNEFLTSVRKTNFNNLNRIGLVRVEASDKSNYITAFGAKPSVGGQSQRMIFSQHPDNDCIVHFHCELKPGSLVPVVSQREYECGSMECGQNTSNGLKRFGGISAVYLDQHGPNIVFHHSINPQTVIDFIEENFDLSSKTGGPVNLGSQLAYANG